MSYVHVLNVSCLLTSLQQSAHAKEAKRGVANPCGSRCGDMFPYLRGFIAGVGSLDGHFDLKKGKLRSQSFPR